MAEEQKHRESPNLAKSMKRSNKPLMEKRRRERINSSLEELKQLVLEALNRDTSQYSKLEKADILEMTVKHLRGVQRQQLALAAAADSTVVGKYRAGFSECAQEVTRYLGQVEGLNGETRQKLEHHLQNCLHSGSNQSQPQNPCLPANQQQLNVGIPAATPVTSLPGAIPQAVQQIPVINSQGIPQGVPQFFGAVQMVPGTVMGTDVTLLLPTSQMCSSMTSSHNNHHRHTGSSASVSPSSNRSSPASTVSHDSSSSPCAPSPSSHHQVAPPSHHQVAPPSHHQAAPPSHHQMAPSHHVTSSKSWPQMAPVQNMPVNVQFKEERVWRPW